MGKTTFIVLGLLIIGFLLFFQFARQEFFIPGIQNSVPTMWLWLIVVLLLMAAISYKFVKVSLGR